MDDLSFWTWLRWGSVAVFGAVMLPLAIRQGYLGLKYIRDDLTDYFVRLRRDRLTMSRILIDSRDAMHLKAKGRALALLPGRDQVEIQTPMVRDWSKLPTGGPRQTIDLSSCPGGKAGQGGDSPMARGDLAERIEAAWRSIDQPTVTAVTQALFNQDRREELEPGQADRTGTGPERRSIDRPACCVDRDQAVQCLFPIDR